MKNLLGPIASILIILILAIVTYPALKMAHEDAGWVSRKPTKGGVYLVTGCDEEKKLVIVMPYKMIKSDEPLCDRRLLLKASNPRICKVGTWYLVDNEGMENIIRSPIASLRPEKVPQDPQ